MPEAVAAVLLGALAAAATREVVLAVLVGAPVGAALVAPAAEAARRLRRPRRVPPRPVAVGMGALLAATLVRTIVLVVGDLGTAGALVLLAGAQVLVLVAARAIDGPGGAVPLAGAALLPLAVPAVLAGGPGLAGIAAAQDRLVFAAEAPVAFLLALATAAPPLRGAPRSPARLLALSSGAAVVSVLFVGGWSHPAVLVVGTLVLTAAVVAVETLLPRLGRPARVAWAATALGAVQLGVVVALSLAGLLTG